MQDEAEDEASASVPSFWLSRTLSAKHASWGDKLDGRKEKRLNGENLLTIFAEWKKKERDEEEQTYSEEEEETSSEERWDGIQGRISHDFRGNKSEHRIKWSREWRSPPKRNGTRVCPFSSDLLLLPRGSLWCSLLHSGRTTQQHQRPEPNRAEANEESQSDCEMLMMRAWGSRPHPKAMILCLSCHCSRLMRKTQKRWISGSLAPCSKRSTSGSAMQHCKEWGRQRYPWACHCSLRMRWRTEEADILRALSLSGAKKGRSCCEKACACHFLDYLLCSVHLPPAFSPWDGCCSWSCSPVHSLDLHSSVGALLHISLLCLFSVLFSVLSTSALLGSLLRALLVPLPPSVLLFGFADLFSPLPFIIGIIALFSLALISYLFDLSASSPPSSFFLFFFFLTRTVLWFAHWYASPPKQQQHKHIKDKDGNQQTNQPTHKEASQHANEQQNKNETNQQRPTKANRKWKKNETDRQQPWTRRKRKEEDAKERRNNSDKRPYCSMIARASVSPAWSGRSSFSRLFAPRFESVSFFSSSLFHFLDKHTCSMIPSAFLSPAWSGWSSFVYFNNSVRRRRYRGMRWKERECRRRRRKTRRALGARHRRSEERRNEEPQRERREQMRWSTSAKCTNKRDYLDGQDEEGLEWQWLAGGIATSWLTESLEWCVGGQFLQLRERMLVVSTILTWNGAEQEEVAEKEGKGTKKDASLWSLRNENSQERQIDRQADRQTERERESVTPEAAWSWEGRKDDPNLGIHLKAVTWTEARQKAVGTERGKRKIRRRRNEPGSRESQEKAMKRIDDVNEWLNVQAGVETDHRRRIYHWCRRCRSILVALLQVSLAMLEEMLCSVRKWCWVEGTGAEFHPSRE